MIVPLRSTGLFLNPGPSGTFFSYYTAYLFPNIPLLSPLSQSSGVGCTKPLLPRSRCCLVGPGVSGARSSASFPLSPLIPKNLGFFTLAQLPLSQVRRAACSDQLWAGLGSLEPPPAAGQGHRSIPTPKGFPAVQGGSAGGATVTPNPGDTGDKGKDKQQGLIFTGQSLSGEKLSLGDRVWEWLWNVLGGEGMIWG